jgi:hypothetical protein
MLEYCGITELTGRPGTGKTAIAVEESKRYRTLYIATTTFSARRYGGSSREVTDRIFVGYIGDIEALNAFIMGRLEEVVAGWEIELVVIDSLDHLLCTEEKYPYSRIAAMASKLKRLNEKYSTRMLIVTCCYGSWDVEGLRIANPLLGLSWLYMVNTRYICTREDGARVLSLVHSPRGDGGQLRYEIRESAVLFPESSFLKHG